MARLLIVDDEPGMRTVLRFALEPQYEVVVAASGDEGLKLIETGAPFDAVFSDMVMPGMNGIQFLSAVKERSPDTVRIMITGRGNQQTPIEAVNQSDIFHYLVKPVERKVLLQTAQEAVEHHRLIAAERELLEKTLSGAVRALTDILSISSPQSFARAQEIRNKMRKLALHLRIRETWELEISALLAPIGEITIPAEVMVKAREGRLLQVAESQMLSQIPEFGSKLLAMIPRLEHVAQIVAYQAKHFDGTGFPHDTLAGEEVPLGARMLAVLLAFEALENQGRSPHAALAELRGQAGRFDPELLDAAERCFVDPSSAPADTSAAVAITLKQLTIGHRLVEPVATSHGLRITGAPMMVTWALLQRLRNFADVAGLQEPIFVEELVL